MDRYEETQSALTIDLSRSLYLATIMERYEGQHSALSIAFLSGLYLAIIINL
jgi:hypothetical protein